MKRELHIDGLRGLAALVVVMSHFLCAFYPAAESLQLQDVRESSLELTLGITPVNMLYNGNFAVCIFFVISGYVLSSSFFVSRSKEVVYASAYRRYLRLMIPVFVTSVFYYVFVSEGWLFSKQVSPVADSLWMRKMWNFEPGVMHFLRSTLYDLVAHQNIEPPYNPVLWSIGIELKGSYLVYGFLVLVGNCRFRWLGYILLAAFTLHSYYFLVVAGMALSDVQQHTNVYQPRLWQLILLLVTACYFGSYKDTAQTELWRCLDNLKGVVKPQAIGAVCLFYVCIRSHRAFIWLSNPAAAYLGRISYSLYLVHLLVIGSVSGMAFHFFFSGLSFTYGVSTGATFLVTIVVSLLLAQLCTRWIDDKGVALSKWVYGVVFR